MKNDIRITCVQANPTVGDIAGNIERVRELRNRYRGKTDLLVFSECFATGYPLKDLVLRPGFLREVRVALNRLAEEMHDDGGPAILLGAPREGGPRPYNSAFLIDVDGSMQVTDKARLPNEEVYDEKRTFAEGAAPKPLLFRGLRIGVPICEDFWHGDVVRSLVEQGAEILIVPNGSHFKVGKQAVRVRLGTDTVRRHGIPVLYVNQVGGQDEVVFDGGSYAMARDGIVLKQASFDEAAFTIRGRRTETGILDLAESIEDSTWNDAAFGRYPEDLEAKYLASVLGLRDYVRKCGFPGVLLGISGGFDSAYTAAVAVDALGAENVLGVSMPSALTGQESQSDAAAVASALGIRLLTIPVAAIVEATRAALAPVFREFGRTEEDTTEENQQARARGGMVLMSLSNKLGLMLLTTGNKTEMAVGYATLYGDMDGGYSVIKDVWKDDAYALADWRNAHAVRTGLGPRGVAIPESVLCKLPTAELAADQTDAASLGSYWVLGPLLRHMVEGHKTVEVAARLAQEEARERIPELRAPVRSVAMAGVETDADGQVVCSPEYARRIARLVRLAQYKRNQSPPGVVLSDVDFGPGWRHPIAGRYTL